MTRPTPSAEAQSFRFALPSDHERVELRGEGSETLEVPSGARVIPRGEGFRVEAEAKFAMDIEPRASALSEYTAKFGSSRRVVEERDLVIIEVKGGYAFIALRELVPEWDETERRRFACSSAGAVQPEGVLDGEPRGFSKSEVEVMVASCRTLELPKLK